ncbi:DNA-protecting protein DprA [Aetokthonos hydrillicola Thurmond2011]|jgi:predicted Rossmann fold nucleotide-binding protein DprA/Smf involved in DNA uptake|uniref:DNA-protecting protein DprA n=1 Tax=Aetokthonos hydrillicola Thurmond2011 TaxID=2712845 RepID=A0AAP5I543_9CYAN|nr:DNA-processing protein DprA [Aetokthonos hydrillicola]MBO3464147.1 DNA-processing protein DprA [Aetokthonos hydrillicola CCALA 1050]MDR9894850.1 DNA-protecting protein DprA [Aetokthonos hydrillicola Thurmond2011]
MLNHVLPPDTQAILLLCGSFGQSRQLEPQPLTLSEYNSLAEWLRENQMRPADLLEPTAKKQLEKITGKVYPERLLALLERGAMLSLAVEKWTSQGLWILGRSDTKYPKVFKQRLRHSAPPILYGVGNIELLSLGGLAIVGSRDVSEEILTYTGRVAQRIALEGMQVISGAARGVDQQAMLGVLHAGGTSVGVLADSLTKAAVNSNYRSSIKEGRLTLISSYDPEAGFNVGNAMGRNKYIYALADYALVVNSSVGKGGTWAGAVEALSQAQQIPIFVRTHPTASEGNQQLCNHGAQPFPAEPWNDSLKELLAKATSAVETVEIETVNSPIETQTSQQGLSSPTHSIYEAVLPILLNHLQQPKDIKSLAQYLEVRQSQMQDWLNRAVEEGMVRKTTKPVAYVVNQSATQLSLLSSSPEALTNMSFEVNMLTRAQP